MCYQNCIQHILISSQGSRLATSNFERVDISGFSAVDDRGGYKDYDSAQMSVHEAFRDDSDSLDDEVKVEMDNDSDSIDF